MRLKLVPRETNFDFFRFRTVTMGASIAAVRCIDRSLAGGGPQLRH